MPAELDERLEQLVAPSAPADFRELLWERVAERERRAARRRVAAGAVVAIAAAGALSAAGVLALGRHDAGGAAKRYDATRSCSVSIQGGVPVVRLQAHSTYRFYNNGKWFTLAANAGLLTKEGDGLGGVGAVPGGYRFRNPGICGPAPQIPLTRSGLPLAGVFKPGEPGIGSTDNGAQCLVGAHVTVRVRAVVGSNDTPISGALAMRTGKKLRPVVYVDWTPKRVAVYMSDDCNY
jgi:hypothetical protein